MKDTILKNWKSGLTVSLVSIPLALALAIASGATPTQGIITALWAGLLGAMFGGSHFNIIGPTGAISGILISYTITHGYETLPLIAILSGLMILVSYLFHLDRYIIFIPRSVVHGFTLGVAGIIGFGQLDNILGLSGMEKSENFLTNTWTSLSHISTLHMPTTIVFVIATLFIFFWNKKFPKAPGAIIIAFVSILTMLALRFLEIPVSIMTLGDKYPSIVGTLFENSFNNVSWKLILNNEIWLISGATAIIAILETLLSGQIADNMTNTKFNRSKEMLGLGIANIGSGVMGGIPATAALARTALNIKSGATHKTSGVINALCIAIISLFLLSYFTLLPMPIIASILVIVAIGMVEKKHFIRLIEEKKAFVLSIAVAVLVIAEDPIIGILIGTVIALLIFVHKVSYGQTEILIWKNGKMIDAVLKNEFVLRETIPSDIIVYKISGTLTYINMPAHLEAIQKIRGNNYVIISLRHAFYADIDGIDYLEEIVEILKQHNDHVIIAGVNNEIEQQIIQKEFYKRKMIEGKIYKRTSEALQSILHTKKI